MPDEKPKRTRRAKSPGTVLANVLRELAHLNKAERHQVLGAVLAYYTPPEQLVLPTGGEE